MPIDWKILSGQPVFFERNRVARVYDGGRLFADFFGDEPVDGKKPEEWIASTVLALNEGGKDPREGLSLVAGTDIPFRELLAREPDRMLSPGGNFDVLVKALDSAIRLPVQTHPDPAFSRKHFHSPFGKTEMWLVLKTRPNACIYYGFKERLTKERFAEAVAKSETDRDAMEPLLNRTEVQPGEVYLIHARHVHAIGAGCLMLEVQEPADFTIQPEHWCGEYRLNAREMYLGLAPDTALECFDFSVFGPEALRLCKKTPRLIYEADGCRAESLIDKSDTPCFSVRRDTVTGARCALSDAPALYVVTEGEGELHWDGGVRALRRGAYFFLPYCLKGKAELYARATIEVVRCLPPEETLSHS